VAGYAVSMTRHKVTPREPLLAPSIARSMRRRQLLLNALQPLLDLISFYIVLPVLFGLVNVQLVLLYLLPFESLGIIRSLTPFARFLAVPVTVSAIAYGVFLFRSKVRGWRRSLSMNLLIFVTFWLSAEIYKDALILIAAARTPHDCLHIHTFAGAVHEMGEFAPAHAVMIVGDTPYLWSYSELKFVKGMPRHWADCSILPFLAF
jgi:hypothetical protein